MEIAYYQSKYYDDLLAFTQSLWPEKTEEYLKYRLFQFPESSDDNRNNLLVLNNEGRIVGCILYFVTKALILGKEEKIFWGHDFYVEEKYRGAASLRLMVEMANVKPAFGAGATELNLKIQKAAGAKFIAIEYHHLLFNFWSFKLPLIKLNLLKPAQYSSYIFPLNINTGSFQFRKIESANELNIPNNGYWNTGDMDIEFVRDKHFLQNRFFENFIKYNFYKLDTGHNSKQDECYFVVRPVFESGFPVMAIVDFRYNKKEPEQFLRILRAANKIAKRNRLPLASLRNSMKIKRLSFFPLMYRTNSRQYIGGPQTGNSEPRLLVTCADSDTDFLSNY